MPIAGGEEVDDERVGEAVRDVFEGGGDEGGGVLREARGDGWA